MSRQHVSQTKVRFAQFATSSLLILQATIATAAISAFATQPAFAQAVKTKAQSSQLFETKPLSITAKDLAPSPAVACWTNAASQNCSYTINPSHAISLERPKPDQLSTTTMVIPVSAATCWTNAVPQACSYTVSISQFDRINPYPLQQIARLPNFDTPIDHVILVRVQF